MDTEVVIAGGGPAGIVAGVLLARQGIDVVVLEKHADFLAQYSGTSHLNFSRGLVRHPGLK
jgi:2-polyprenyl-6-methoxyphenol hydroxylase-like FAD-dependent oxidoreductase